MKRFTTQYLSAIIDNCTTFNIGNNPYIYVCTLSAWLGHWARVWYDAQTNYRINKWKNLKTMYYSQSSIHFIHLGCLWIIRKWFYLNVICMLYDWNKFNILLFCFFAILSPLMYSNDICYLKIFIISYSEISKGYKKSRKLKYSQQDNKNIWFMTKKATGNRTTFNNAFEFINICNVGDFIADFAVLAMFIVTYLHLIFIVYSSVVLWNHCPWLGGGF